MNSYQESLLVGLIRILANVFMIGALFLAMYQATHSYGSGVLLFCAWFFGVTIPVWVLAWYLIKRVRKNSAANFESYVLLPGAKEPCLVHWSVIQEGQESASPKK